MIKEVIWKIGFAHLKKKTNISAGWYFVYLKNIFKPQIQVFFCNRRKWYECWNDYVEEKESTEHVVAYKAFEMPEAPKI